MAGGGEKCEAECGVGGVDLVEGAVASGDKALVGDDDQAEAGGVELLAGRDRAREWSDEGGVAQVAALASGPGFGRERGVLDEGVVAVEEDGGSGHGAKGRRSQRGRRARSVRAGERSTSRCAQVGR